MNDPLGSRCDYERPILSEIKPYVPGKPISEVARELGVVDIIKLASNENPLGPSPKAMEAVRAALSEANLYPDGAGFALRHKLAHFHDYIPDGILLGNGSVELIEVICEAFLEPHLEAITGPQAFFKYRIACQIMGVQPIMVAMPEYNYDVEAMIRAFSDKTRLVFIANPNNPTGTYLSRDKIDRILNALPSEAILVLDEAYFEFVENEDYPNGLDYVREGRQVIVLRTFSKAYGLAGLRCGYAMTTPAIAASMHKVREVFNCNSLAQIAGAAALDDKEFLAETIALNKKGLVELREGLSARGLTVVPSVCNFVLVDFKQPIGPIFQALLRQGVIIRPMEPYDMPTCARISTSLPEHHKKLFSALDIVLK